MTLGYSVGVTVEEDILAFLRTAPEGEWVSKKVILGAVDHSEASVARCLKQLREDEDSNVEAKAIPKDDRKRAEYTAGGPMAPWHYRWAGGDDG